MDSTMNPKVKTMEGEGVGARSLTRSTLKVHGHVRALGWGTTKIDKRVNYLHGPTQTKP